jgi:hypothetical protein
LEVIRLVARSRVDDAPRFGFESGKVRAELWVVDECRPAEEFVESLLGVVFLLADNLRGIVVDPPLQIVYRNIRFIG